MINNIQIRRAFAALSVVFFHLDYPGFKLGSFGVDVFFVISGFIMTHICNEDPGHFLLRRMTRIIPMYWLLTLLLAAAATLRPDWLHSTSVTAAYLAQSLLFIPYAKDNGTLFPILGVGWTLNFEMMFYLLTALFLYASRRLATLYASLALLGLYLFAQATGSQLDFFRFYASEMSLEFLLGVLSYWALKLSALERIRPGYWAMCAAAMVAVLALGEVYSSSLGLPAARLWSVGLAASLLLVAAVRMEASAARFQHRYLILLGNASYVLYLLHLFIIQFFNRVLPDFDLFGFHGLRLAFMAAVTVLVSVWVHRKLELPLNLGLKNYLLRATSR